MELETLAIHAGFSPDPATQSVAVPIYQTSSYAFLNTQHGADLFDLKIPGNIYTRLMNPTTDVLEKRLAALEGGKAALAFASGAAAITAAIQTITQAGDNIVSTSTLYGGTYNLFAQTFPSFGVDVRFADSNNLESFIPKIDEKTRAIYCESIGNPLGNITDFEKLAQIAHDHGLPLIVDHTVMTPFLCRPIEYGADIIIHSLTKYLGGHGNSLGGIIVDAGNFKWNQNPEKFPLLNTPDSAYHGMIYAKDVADLAFITRARVSPLRNMGAALSPFNAFLILQGIESCALRMERICENALKIAQFLDNHPKVAWVNYAGLKNHINHALAQKYCQGKASGILTFGIQSLDDPKVAGTRFQDALKLFTRLVNIGDSKSLACHPASTTHRQLNDEELKAAGVSKDMMRLSIGIEHIDDLIADLTQALDAV